jgi:hypothetical protein
MELEIFPSMEAALWSFVKNHKSHILIPHKVEASEEARLHYHRLANEWFLASNGYFRILVDQVERYVTLYNEKTILIFIPKGAKHRLEAYTAMKYLVVRDKQDRNIYCQPIRSKTIKTLL